MKKVKNKLLALIVLFSPHIMAQKTIPNWLAFPEKETANDRVDVFENKNYFQLGENSEMIKYKEYVDEIGMKHERYIQTYKGIRVEEGHYILHYSNGELKKMNGATVSGLNIDYTTIIDENVAITNAVNKFIKDFHPIKNYLIEKPAGYVSLSKDKNLKGSLVITSESSVKNEDKAFLICYKFNIVLAEDHSSYTAYVNALTGDVISIRTNVRNCGIGTATGTTFYNGTQTFVTKWTGSIGKYKLYDDCRKIYTYDGGGSPYKDNDNVWTDTDDREGVSVHWGLQRTFDFFEYAYNLTGVDGFYQQVDALADWTNGNAQWGSNQVRIGGEGGGFNSYASLDIIGHEWTHGVDEYSANLVYQDESGALDESFADIFGTMVEYYVEGAHSGTYLMGDDPGAIRSLSNPSTYGHPSIYEGTNWHDYNTDPSDFGGVHTNSGVQNHWFYLLAEGGSQTVGSTTYTVTGIGIENAAYVAYKNRRDYLSSNSEFADSKNGSIFAAIDIWGECDWKVEQVIKAWNAVGVSSTNGVAYDNAVNCSAVSFLHSFGIPYNHKVINNLTSNCTYAPGKITSLTAGNEIRLQPGSNIEGDFIAHIYDCLDSNMRTASSPYPNNYGGFGNTAVDIDKVTLVSDVSIYPNPTVDGKFNVELPENTVETHVEVVNLMGAIIYTSQVTESNRVTFDIAEQPKGIYLVRIISNGNSITKKIIYN